MILTHEELLNLPVYTKSNQHLGKVQGFEIDADSQTIIRYYVKSENLIEHIIHNRQLIIHNSQVIEITPEKMIVDDNTEPEPLKFRQAKFPAQREAVAAMSSQR